MFFFEYAEVILCCQATKLKSTKIPYKGHVKKPTALEMYKLDVVLTVQG